MDSLTIEDCRMCGLWKNRYKIVNGKGPVPADIMFIGEAPGRNEDLKGEPFVGRAGEILDNVLSLLDEDRSGIYITNVVKCRPPNNRRPKATEKNMCRPHLDKEIAAVKPKKIVLLGKTATETFLPNIIGKFSDHVGRMIKMKFKHGEVDLIVCFHPMYIGYNPGKLQDLRDALSLAFTHDLNIKNEMNK